MGSASRYVSISGDEMVYNIAPIPSRVFFTYTVLYVRCRMFRSAGLTEVCATTPNRGWDSDIFDGIYSLGFTLQLATPYL